MRHIVKSNEPDSLARFNRTFHPDDWSILHNENNHVIYDDCLSQCKLDQNELCGYTEVKLNKNTHIDHFIKRSLDPSKTFCWENMIAAVHDSKFGADFKDNNRDNMVKMEDYDNINKRYYHIINPVNNSIIGRFCYSTDGMIEPVKTDDIDAIETIRVFNLNEQSLVNRRKQAMESVRYLLDAGMSKDEVMSYLKNEEFISAIEYEIKEYK